MDLIFRGSPSKIEETYFSIESVKIGGDGSDLYAIYRKLDSRYLDSRLVARLISVDGHQYWETTDRYSGLFTGNRFQSFVVVESQRESRHDPERLFERGWQRGYTQGYAVGYLHGQMGQGDGTGHVPPMNFKEN